MCLLICNSVRGRLTYGKYFFLQICYGSGGNYNYNISTYFKQEAFMKVILIDNPKFFSFLLRKIYKIKKEKQVS